MAQDFSKQYTDAERFRRGIDRILKSDQYTDEYKQVLMDKLGNDYNVPKEAVSSDVEFDLLKSGGPVITISQNSGSLINLNDKPAAVSGYIEKPTYLEDELTKAVDVVVDELIKPPPKQKPLTVPKEVYDDLTEQYNKAVSDLEDLRAQLNAKIAELETAISEINLLNQTVDSEKLLRAAADNETQSSTERYTSVLKDFQTAMQKGIQEAIERVSLTAQVRGLQAQKEALQQQLENLKSITETLLGQIDTQQLQIEAQQNEIERQQEEAAAAFLLTGQPGTFGKTNNSGWKIPDSNVGKSDFGNSPLWFDKKKGVWENGDKVEFYNLSNETLVFTLTYAVVKRKEVSGDNTKSPWIIASKNIITVPPRNESDPGIEPVTFTKRYIWQPSRAAKTWNRSAYAEDIITVSVSNGDSFTIGAMYKLRD